MGKLVFLDIDGTIRDFDGNILESTITSIQKARANGHKVFICTGRPYFQIEKRIHDIGFDGVVSGSGSYVVLDGKRIKHDCFTLLTYIALCDYLTEHNYVLEIQTYHNNYILASDQENFANVGKTLMEKIGIGSGDLPKMPTTVDTIMDVSDVEKVLYFGNRLSIEDIRREWGEDLNIVPLSIPSFDHFGGEISPITVNKAEGIKSILEELQGEREDVIAIGDSENDLEMIRFAQVGIAMGNAKSNVKEAANDITDTIKHHGIQKAFQKYGLL